MAKLPLVIVYCLYLYIVYWLGFCHASYKIYVKETVI